jgi:hypothetical protein
LGAFLTFSIIFFNQELFAEPNLKLNGYLKELNFMRILLIILAILSGYGYVQAQETETKDNISGSNPFANYKELPAYNIVKSGNSLGEAAGDTNNTDASFLESKRKKQLFEFVEADKKKEIGKTEKEKTQWIKQSSQNKNKEKFHWKPALIQSAIFLGIQHGYRVLGQKYTRDELAGHFFRDWAKSVKSLRGWNDGNPFFINYVAHPLQGGLTGRIFVVNSDRAAKQEFGKSKKYWEGRLKAMAWSAVWSTQFELGPISEANIGNVGLRRKAGYSSMAYVDLVVTPLLGTGVLIGEDAIDKYILKNWVERNAQKTTVKIRILRSILTPMTSVSNMLRGKVPWKRDNRSL